MNKYGFDTPAETVKLPPSQPRKAGPSPNMERVLQAGAELGFISREAVPARRKTGPKRTEPQDKMTIAGPKRVIDRLKAYSERLGVPYHEAIDALLDRADGK
jgi:hypothetical protein